MQAKQIYCTQCGAVIPPGEARCPYCGSSYAPEAEREYMRKLDQVRSDLDKVGNIGEETSRTEAGRIRKRVFRILAVFESGFRIVPMKTENIMQRKKHFSILNLLIIILSIILAISIIITLFIVRDTGSTYYASESSLYYSLSNQEYSSLTRRYYDGAAGNEEDSHVKKTAEYYAVGLYFEKAFFANAYKKTRDPDAEKKYRQQMEELEPQMGQFSAEKEQILKIFPDL